MTYKEQVIDRFDRAYSNCPIILNDEGFEELMAKIYIPIWVYDEYYRAELMLDGLYQRFGYAELAPAEQ